MAFDFDLFVIGAGSGGVRASRLLPDAGLDNLIVVASTEVNTDEDRAAYVAALSKAIA